MFVRRSNHGRIVKKASLAPAKAARDNSFPTKAHADDLRRKGQAAAMTDDERNELLAQLARLRQEHRDLDTAIEALQVSPGKDIIQVQRLKKRKLQLRDRIEYIEDQLTPDITA
jgi:hypothetical protein